MMKFRFSGKASKPSQAWDKGFKEGYEFAIKTFNPNTGRHNEPFPEYFQHRFGEYNRGFGEGIITGRHKVIDDTFPNHRSVSWDENGAHVTY